MHYPDEIKKGNQKRSLRKQEILEERIQKHPLKRWKEKMESYYLYYTLKDYWMKSDEGKRDEEKWNHKSGKVIRNEIQRILTS